uniref:Uncharacterized protein n=1 Tax=Manihot esculenta TaxID=3983 RepID=A0A2C9V006_MANES
MLNGVYKWHTGLKPGKPIRKNRSNINCCFFVMGSSLLWEWFPISEKLNRQKLLNIFC